MSRSIEESAAFEWVSTQIEQTTPLNRLQARGTVRLVLKEMGLDPRYVDKGQMKVVVSGEVLKRFLVLRGMTESEVSEGTQRIVTDMQEVHFESSVHRDTPEQVFARFGAS